MIEDARLIGIPYEFSAGPLTIEKLVTDEFPPTTNCQRAVQLFLLHFTGQYLYPHQILSEEITSYYGLTVAENPIDPRILNCLDIICARNRTLGLTNESVDMKKLHLALVVKGLEKVLHVETEENYYPVFHATKERGSHICSWQEFIRDYEPFRVKRLPGLFKC